MAGWKAKEAEGAHVGGNWWDGMPGEHYWVEIRSVPGTGYELWSPNRNQIGRRDPWYELVSSVRAGETVLHWHAGEHRFVGRSVAAADASEDAGTGTYRVPLQRFEAFPTEIGLERLRTVAPDLYRIRDELRRQHGDPLRLPFQFKADPGAFGFMSNYFAKMPARMVEVIFGGRLAAPPTPRTAHGTSPRPSFLRPFKPKADTTYVARVRPALQVRTRDHETLVNSCADWLFSMGLRPCRNAAVDLGVEEPPILIEAKVVGASWSDATRDAVGQLYEYRYFRVGSPEAALIFLADRPVPEEWVRYLEEDRGIGVLWPQAPDFYRSKLARRWLYRAASPGPRARTRS